MQISTQKIPAFLFIILAIFMFFLIIGPRVSDEQQRKHCVYNIHLPGPFGLSLNCDSLDFLSLADNPKIFLQKGNVRQDRPGFIVLASALSKFYPLKMNKAMRRAVHIATVNGNGYYMPIFYFKYYVAYIIINIAVLVLSFWFFSKIIFKKCLAHLFK